MTRVLVGDKVPVGTQVKRLKMRLASVAGTPPLPGLTGELVPGMFEIPRGALYGPECPCAWRAATNYNNATNGRGP
jgi:hypothetical protein